MNIDGVSKVINLYLITFSKAEKYYPLKKIPQYTKDMMYCR